MGKPLFTILVALLLVHSLAFIGFLGYGAATGRLGNESRIQYLATWRGEKLVPPTPEEEVIEEKESPQQASARIAAAEEQHEIVARGTQRDIELSRYMQTLVTQAQTKLEKDIRQLRAREADFDAKVVEHNRKTREEGFLKNLKNYSKMSPKNVKADFMIMDEHDVVRYLAAMKADVAAGVLKRFKTPEEQQKRVHLVKLLESYGTVDPDEKADKVDLPEAAAMAR